MTCPHCNRPLSEIELKALWGAYTSSMRVTKTGGRNGGRPPKKATAKKRARK